MANRTRERIPLETGSFHPSMSMREARKLEMLAQRFGKLVRQLVALDDQSFKLVSEMLPRTSYGDIPMRDATLAEAVGDLRDKASGERNHGIQFPFRPIIQDSLEEVRDRRIARTQRNLDFDRQSAQLHDALDEAAENAKRRLSEMVRDHFEKVPVSDGELDDGPMGSYG